MTDDRAAKRAEELLPWETFSCETADEETWQQLADGIAAELREAYEKNLILEGELVMLKGTYQGAKAEIARLRAELASIEQFAESWPCHCAENYPGATMYHGHDCQTAIAVEFVAQWRAAKVKP